MSDERAIEGMLAAVVAEMGRCRSHLLTSGDLEGARSLQRAMGHVKRAMRTRATTRLPDVEPNDLEDETPEPPVPASFRKARRAARREMKFEEPRYPAAD